MYNHLEKYIFILITACFFFSNSVVEICYAQSITEQKVTALDGNAFDKFGDSVAISGNHAVVGAYGDDDNGGSSGSAYIFSFDGTYWIQSQKLTASDGKSLDKFGYSVSISGNYAVVGAYGDDDNGESSGSAYIFSFDGTNWVQSPKLTASDGVSWDKFGKSVAISGNYVIIGAPGSNDGGESSGSAYVFFFNGSTWQEVQKLTASDGTSWDNFGHSVVVSGNIAVIGAPVASGTDVTSGSAYIFQNNTGSWTQVQKLTASDGASWDKFGHALALSGTDILIGAPGDDDNSESSGSAYLYTNNGSSWIQSQKFLASDGAYADYFGNSVSINGNYIVIGAYGNDYLGISSGASYLFLFNGASWAEDSRWHASYGMPADYFGKAVAFSGYFALVSSHGDDDNGESSGSLAIYWNFVTDIDTDGDTIPDDLDNCPTIANLDQVDWDDDGIGDVCDNCPAIPNNNQSDVDNDTLGDVCDNGDTDGDGFSDKDETVCGSNPADATSRCRIVLPFLMLLLGD